MAEQTCEKCGTTNSVWRWTNGMLLCASCKVQLNRVIMKLWGYYVWEE